MEEQRASLIEDIDVALVALRGTAQPHEVAELNELRLDAQEAEDEVSLAQIAAQVTSLRKFCEQRKKSSGRAFRIDSPPQGRRSA